MNRPFSYTTYPETPQSSVCSSSTTELNESNEFALYQDVVELNNCGVKFLTMDNRAAIILFRAALEKMRELLGVPTSSKSFQQGKPENPQKTGADGNVCNIFSSSCENHEQEAKYAFVPDQPSSDSTSRGEIESIFSSLHPQAPFTIELLSPIAHMQTGIFENVFVRAFYLIPSNHAYSPDPMANLTVAFALVIFNMAIAFHWQALHVSKHVEVCPKQASSAYNHANCSKQLYNKVQFVLQRIGISCNISCGHPVIDLLCMALLNNLAQIHSIYPDTGGPHVSPTAASCHYANQLSLYCSTVHPFNLDVETANIMCWYLSCFLLHAQFFQIPAMAAAA